MTRRGVDETGLARVLLVSACLLALAAVPAGAAGVDDARVETVVDGGDADGNETDGNGTALPPHRNPDEVDESGDAAHVRSVLGFRLARQLEGSAISIDRGEYETAREFLGDDYDEMLSQYVVVEGETDGDGAAASDELEETKAEQEELARLLDRFDERFEEYETAREQGDTQRARALARELLDLAAEIEALGGSLDERYDRLEAFLNVDLSRAKESTGNATDRTARMAQQLIETEFVETRLTVTADDEVVSFAEPTTVRGSLETENGTPVANESVRLVAGKDVLRTETDENGSFAVDYRPLQVAPGTEPVVHYRPPAESEYLGSSARLPAEIVSTNATIVIDSAPETLAYGDDVVVSGRLVAAGDPVPGAKLATTLQGTSLSTGETNATGGFEIGGPLPAAVSPGERPLAVRLANEELAVAAEAATRQVAIDSTETSLFLDATATERRLDVSGRLTTVDGTGLADREVIIRIGERTVETVRTDGDGAFETTLETPADAEPGDEIAVEASFDGGGTLFEDATAVDRVTLPTPAGADSTLPGTTTGVGGALLPFVLLVTLAGAIRWLRSRGRTPESPGSVDRPSTAGETATTNPATAMLEAAVDRLEAGEEDAAVRAAFASVRRELAERTHTSPGATHWEFYRNCLEAGVSNPDAVETVTKAFERAVFDPRGAGSETAERAVSGARDVIEATRERLPDDVTAPDGAGGAPDDAASTGD